MIPTHLSKLKMNIKIRKMCLIALLYAYYKIKGKRQRKRWWVRNIFLNRKTQGSFYNLIEEMRLSDTEKYINYLRMSPSQFEEILALVGPDINRLHTRRGPINAAQRLACTLRYLASGDSMISISYAFRLGKTTVSHIVRETCQAIWQNLKKKTFCELNEPYWVKCSKEFKNLWQLPLCIGAIDGKHVIIQAPPNSGSQFYNYKNSHSIILMALVDAKYKFIIVDIGAQGRQSDGGVFRYSEIGKQLLNNSNNEMNLPPPKALEVGGNPTHYYVVGDAAFPLTPNIMRPYAGRYLPQYKRIFNYRLSRGRRVSENAFGILASRWRILRKPIIASLTTIESMVQALVTLHNYLIDANCDKYCPQTLIDREDDGNLYEGEWRQDVCTNLLPVGRVGTNTYKQNVEEMRENLALYFYTEGAVPFQWDK